jgi:uncharacterized protein
MDASTALLELQDRDLQIARLTKQLDEMPEKRAILTARVKLGEIRKLLARTEAYRRGVEAEIKRLEDETAAVSAKMESEQAKLVSGEVTHPKELQAIALELLELDSLRRHREKLDDAELDQLSKREAAIAQSDKVRVALATGEKNEAALIDDFKDKGSHLIGDIDALKAERERLADSLTADVRKRYELLRETKHGIAVGRLDGECCGVCRVSIPQGTLDMLHAGPTVGTCPNCSRMLIVEVDS